MALFLWINQVILCKNLNPKDGAYNPGQFDAFTAGIEDGGLRAKSSISAMVCYILANIEKPLSIKNITDALTAGCIANYFEICDSIDRLKAAGQIVEKDDRLYATPQCKAAVELIENDLPLTMREKEALPVANGRWPKRRISERESGGY